jgi:hypothetical protein
MKMKETNNMCMTTDKKPKRNKLQPTTSHGAGLQRPADPTLRRVPKICGSDFELGNFVLGDGLPDRTGHHASHALLERIDGVSPTPRFTGYVSGGWGWGRGGYAVREANPVLDSISSYDSSYPINSQDWGRKYLRNGGCAYIDLAHLEICVPEVRSAWDHVAANRAMLEIARRAQTSLNDELPDAMRVEVLANNSDGRGNSYGTHLNICLTRQAWDDIFCTKLQNMLLLASFQVSSIVITGQGKVGSENGQSWTPFQLSQRADFMETLVGLQTTHRRPIVNSRDETLCGEGEEPGGDLARLHVIFYDNNLCQVASLLKIGTLQIVTAMLEAGWCDLGLILEDPVAAVVRYSHGADLTTQCPLAAGESTTAVDLQRRFVVAAREALAAGVLDTVPRADEIIALWDDTLSKLAAGDLDALVGRLDWVLKQRAIEQTLEQHDDLDWASEEVLYLDQLYSSLDRERGLFWRYEASGIIESVVSEETIARFIDEPPADTRAWTRARLLEIVEAGRFEAIDWHEMKLFRETGRSWGESVRISLGDPGAGTREENEAFFEKIEDADSLIRSLAACDEEDDENATPDGGRKLLSLVGKRRTQ